MTRMRKTPKNHGQLVSHGLKGSRSLSITLAGKSPHENRCWLQYTASILYNRCIRHTSTILWDHHGERLDPQEQAGKQCDPVTGETAVQNRLLLYAIAQTGRADKAERLACATAEMRPCQSSWWYPCARNRRRSRSALGALTLTYA